VREGRAEGRGGVANEPFRDAKTAMLFGEVGKSLGTPVAGAS
jgi:hypothetical protein